MIESLSPAKVNLFLAVTGRRPDGYHELVTLMVCVKLYDRIRFDFQARGISVRCSVPGIPEDATNLVCRAATAFRRAQAARGLPCGWGLRMTIDKQIPAGAGLGGGSSNAATVLKVLNQRFEQPFSRAELAAMALALGADVPFFLEARPAVARGIGERLEAFPHLRPMPLVIVYPGQALATADVFGDLNLRLTKCEKKLNELLLKMEEFDPGVHLCNDLEPVAARRCPDVMPIKAALKELGAAGALMTGSGSAVFGLFEKAQEAHSAGQILARNPNWQVFRSALAM
jgi:4-diphosphocytidyl-2-C-methyl-D-erythritol kinase